MHPRPPPQQIKNCLMLFSTLRCPSDHPVIRSAWNPDTDSPSHLGSLSLVAQRKRSTTSLYGVTVVGTNALFAPARRTKKRPSPSGCTYLKTSQPQQPSLCSRERLDEALDWRGLQTAAPGKPRRLAEIQWRRTLPTTHHPPPLPPGPAIIANHPGCPPARSPPTSSASGLRHRMGTAEMLLLQVGDPVVSTAEKMGNIDALPIAASLEASQQAQGQAAHGQQAESTSRTAVPLAADVELVDDAQAGQGLQDGAGTLQCTLPPLPSPSPSPSLPGQRPAVSTYLVVLGRRSVLGIPSRGTEVALPSIDVGSGPCWICPTARPVR